MDAQVMNRTMWRTTGNHQASTKSPRLTAPSSGGRRSVVCLRETLLLALSLRSSSRAPSISSLPLPSKAIATAPATAAPQQPAIQHIFLQSQTPLSTAQQRPREGPGGPNSDPSPQGPTPPDPQPGDGNDPGGPDGGMPFRLRYWILLLAEYGGIYGTVAVLIAAVTHVDPFGGLHWDANDVALGLGLMAPALAFDALVGLPDWTTRHEDAEQLVRLFVDPELMKSIKQPSASASSGAGKSDNQPSSSSDQPSSSTTSAAVTAMMEDVQTRKSDRSSGAVAEAGSQADASLAAARATNTIPSTSGLGASETTSGELRAVGTPATTTTTATTSSATPGSARGASASPTASSGPLWVATARLRMAMELMQESSIRNNPGARLTPLQEGAVIAVAVTADEMLYRAVLLTLFGRWLRDRFYEAGAEDVIALPVLLGGQAGAGAGGAPLELDTATVAQVAALAVGAAAGAAVFAAKAWQEATMARRLRDLQRLEMEETAKALRKQRLLGQHMSEEEVREQTAKQARLHAAHVGLMSSMGVQGALVWALEGGREVYQVAAAGAAFILTGNLAAPLAGSVAAQVLVSAYQRLGLQRNMKRRAEVVARRRQRRLEEAAAAAATATTTTTAATATPVAEATSQEGATVVAVGSSAADGGTDPAGAAGAEADAGVKDTHAAPVQDGSCIPKEP